MQTWAGEPAGQRVIVEERWLKTLRLILLAGPSSANKVCTNNCLILTSRDVLQFLGYRREAMLHCSKLGWTGVNRCKSRT